MNPRAVLMDIRLWFIHVREICVWNTDIWLICFCGIRRQIWIHALGSGYIDSIHIGEFIVN